MINCADAVQQLWEYLDRELSPTDFEAVEQHLAFCRRCCGELEFARELHRFLASREAIEMPAEVRSKLERFVAEL